MNKTTAPRSSGRSPSLSLSWTRGREFFYVTSNNLESVGDFFMVKTTLDMY